MIGINAARCETAWLRQENSTVIYTKRLFRIDQPLKLNVYNKVCRQLKFLYFQLSLQSYNDELPLILLFYNKFQLTLELYKTTFLFMLKG